MRLVSRAIPLFLFAASAWAGGGPQNVLVVVNDNSLESLELGQYYQERRGIPERNVCHISTTTNYSIGAVAFSNEIRQPVLSYVVSAMLSNQVDYIVFSKDIPYRVFAGDAATNADGITAAMFYHYRAAPVCDTPDNASRSDYFDSERAFTHAGSPSGNRYYLSFALTSTNMDNARMLVDRSVEADYTQPSGTVFLFHTMNPRNVQWGQFENADFCLRFLSVPQRCQLVDGYFSNAVTNAVGVMVGHEAANDTLESTFAKGALAEHLTSYGGCLYENSGQQSVMDWIHAGCVATYGTVIEPCAETNKFPQPKVHFWYARGFSAGESYWMAVRNPYQGVYVGDPLCSPYAITSSVDIAGIASSQVVSGTVGLSVTGRASSAVRPLAQIDLFLDGLLLATVTNVAPRASNVVGVAINGTNCTYVVSRNPTIYSVATGLAAHINASNLGVRATAFGDRIELRQNPIGVPGAYLSCAPTSDLGTASEFTTVAWTPFTNFLETTCAAHEQLTLNGAPVSGDVLRVVITTLVGETITNEAVAVAGDDRNTLLVRLAGAVNSNAGLQDSSGCEMKWVTVTNIWENPSVHEGYLVARTNTWEGEKLFVQYSVITNAGSTLSANNSFTDNFNDNSNVLSARGVVFIAGGRTNLAADYSLVTTALPDGPHELTAVAYDGTAVGVQTRRSVIFVVDNNSAACAITNPPALTTFLLGDRVTAYVQASPGSGSITSVQFFVEGKLLTATNSAPYVFAFSATNYGVGQLGLQAKAFSSAGEQVLSSNLTIVILPDYDFDGLDDRWEIQNFGSITAYDGTGDPDGDGALNGNEYLADTQPTNSSSYFCVSAIRRDTNGVFSLVFISSTGRQYRVHYNEDTLTNEAMWWMGANEFPGAVGTTLWVDDGNDIPPPTNILRFYRIGAHRP